MIDKVCKSEIIDEYLMVKKNKQVFIYFTCWKLLIMQHVYKELQMFT